VLCLSSQPASLLPVLLGCPSASELALLWGCRLGSLDDAPVKAEPLSPVLPPVEPSSGPLPGWGSSLPPKASPLGIDLGAEGTQSAGWGEAKAGPQQKGAHSGNLALYGAPPAQQQQPQQAQPAPPQRVPPVEQQAFLGPRTPTLYAPLEPQQGLAPMGGQPVFLGPQGQVGYPGAYQQGPYAAQLYQPFPPPGMQQGYLGQPQYGYQQPYGRQYAPPYAGQPFQQGFGGPPARPQHHPSNSMGGHMAPSFGGRPGLDSPSGLLSKVKVSAP
jgi:hypothetical protein